MIPSPNPVSQGLALSAVRYGRTTAYTMSGFFGPLPFTTKSVMTGTDDWPAAPAGGVVTVPVAGFYLCRATFRHNSANCSLFLTMGSGANLEGEMGRSSGGFVEYGVVGFRYLNAGDSIYITGYAGSSYTPPDGSHQYLDIMRLL